MNNEKIRIYDNKGETADRFTVVYMDEPEESRGCLPARAMDEKPFHPQGFGQYTSAMPGLHLGQRIRFSDLPLDCQTLILRDLGSELDKLSASDYSLSETALIRQYITEHPVYEKSLWKEAVRDGETEDGYWSFAYQMIQKESINYKDIIDAGMSDPTTEDEPLEAEVAGERA